MILFEQFFIPSTAKLEVSKKDKSKGEIYIMSKRILSIVSILLALVMLVSCGGGTTGGGTGGASTGGGSTGGAPTPESTGNVLIEVDARDGMPMEPPSGAKLAEHIDIISNDTNLTVVSPMNPASSGYPSTWIYLLIHDSLVASSAVGVYEPGLAKEWKTDDYKTWTFYLREDAYFHNGDHFTAEDVLWTIEAARIYNTAQPHSRWIKVESARAIDPYTVELTYFNPYPDLLSEISQGFMAILNKRAHDENPDDPAWGWIGTGPFKVTGWATNDFISLERNDDYWGKAPLTKSLTLYTVPEMSTRLVMMRNGEAQLSFQMTPEDLDVLENDPNYNVYPIMFNEPAALAFNWQGDKYMTDINFKKAIAYALNYEDIAEVALGRWAQAPWDGNLWGYDTQYRINDPVAFPKWEQDLELAKEYLAKTDYSGEEINLLVTAPQNIRAAELVQLQLEAIGIKTFVEQTDTPTLGSMKYDENPPPNRQMHLFSFAMSNFALISINYFTSHVNNRLNYNDPYFYDLAAQFGAAFEEEEREEIVHKIQEYWFETVPAIPLFWRLQGIAAEKGIGGIVLRSNQAHDMRGIFQVVD